MGKQKNFRVFGDPIAYTAPKISTRGGFVRTYSPNPYVHWKATVAHQIKNSGSYEGLITGPVCLNLFFFLNRPKSVKVALHCKKPDLDNLCKGVLDAIKGMAIKDDNQVYELWASKNYSTDTAPPGVAITLIIPEKES